MNWTGKTTSLLERPLKWPTWSPPLRLSTPTFCTQLLQWLFKHANLIMSLPYWKPDPCNGFPFHSGWNKTSLTCPTRPYTIWPLPSHTCPSPTIIYPHVILSVPGMGKASPLLGLPTGCSPAWKIIPHLILHWRLLTLQISAQILFLQKSLSWALFLQSKIWSPFYTLS